MATATVELIILDLTLKKHWFDMVLSGIKLEEYRDIKKHWVSRFCIKHKPSVIAGGDLYHKHTGTHFSIKHFDQVRFTNGYGGKRPQATFELLGIEIRTGKEAWGAEPDTIYFVLKLGKEINRKNC